MKLVLLALIAIIILLVSVDVQDTGAECSSDADCAVGGCSGQVCTTVERAATLVTTCEWKPEYACYRRTSCGCVNGTCEWIKTPEFMNCLAGFKPGEHGPFEGE